MISFEYSQYASPAMGLARLFPWVNAIAQWLSSIQTQVRVGVQLVGDEGWTTTTVSTGAQDWDDALRELREGYLILRVSRFEPAIPGANQFCEVPHPSMLREGDLLHVEVIPGSYL